MRIHLNRALVEGFRCDENGLTNKLMRNIINLAPSHAVIDLVFEDLVELKFGVMTNNMIVLTNDNHTVLLLLRHG